MHAPPNRGFIVLIINKMSSSLLTSLFLKKQNTGKSQIFSRCISNKVSPGGSEWQKPPGNKQNNSKAENPIKNPK